MYVNVCEENKEEKKGWEGREHCQINERVNWKYDGKIERKREKDGNRGHVCTGSCFVISNVFFFLQNFFVAIRCVSHNVFG